MLTGTVADSRTRADVLRLVRADKRVQPVYDEIQVVSLGEQARRRAAASKRDASKKEGFERFVNVRAVDGVTQVKSFVEIKKYP